MSSIQEKSRSRKRQRHDKKAQQKVDRRKQLFNDGKIGSIEQIQVSTERITQLNGILFDLDADNFRAGGLLPAIPKKPEDLASKVIVPMLKRHSTLAKCELRMTGSGLHAVLWLDEPVCFLTDGDRERWAAIVQVVQAALPIDPDQPGITATTRAVGSVNGKNGRKVKRLRRGKPVTEGEVIELYEEICTQPFRTVMQILAGSSNLYPCPICQHEDSTLNALDYAGRCYGKCGTVKLEQLYDLVLAPRCKKQKGAS